MQHYDGGSRLRNLLLTITYDGKAFHGWQIQQNAFTVQEAFQNALSKIIGNGFEIKGCSRTDSGVHANMYCISLKTTHSIPPQRLKAALNRWLPLSVAVLDCKDAEESFHARYSCKSKEYVYKIWNSEVRNPFLDGYALHYRYKLDENMLNEAAQAYVGSHDFTSFCTQDMLMRVEADGFLYNMVRIMVGTLLRIQQGKIPPDGISSIIEKKDRQFAGPTAPACGLYLNQVNY